MTDRDDMGLQGILTIALLSIAAAVGIADLGYLAYDNFNLGENKQVMAGCCF